MSNIQLAHAVLDLKRVSHHMYDVLVVGAGPAGSSAAFHLASQGVDVLLVDRSSFPREKSCGDAVMPPAMHELMLMGLADQVASRFAATHGVSLWYGSAGEQRVAQDLEAPGYVAPRVSLDALLRDHALQVGASWLDGITITAVDRHRQDIAVASGISARERQEVTLSARIVIAADGSGSRLAQTLRKDLEARGEHAALTAPEDAHSRFTALRGYFTEIAGLTDMLEFYFPGERGTHYYWVFPVGNGLANVGVIARLAQSRAAHTRFAESVDTFLHSAAMARRGTHAARLGAYRAAPIAAGLRGTALYGEHMLCVGDAAALVDPRSAEGISGALASGRLAAQTAQAALTRQDYSLSSLQEYGHAIRERFQTRYDVLLISSELSTL